MQASFYEVAKRFNIPYIASSFSKEEGTMIIQEKDKLENIAVTGVTQTNLSQRSPFVRFLIKLGRGKDLYRKFLTLEVNLI